MRFLPYLERCNLEAEEPRTQSWERESEEHKEGMRRRAIAREGSWTDDFVRNTMFTLNELMFTVVVELKGVRFSVPPSKLRKGLHRL